MTSAGVRNPGAARLDLDRLGPVPRDVRLTANGIVNGLVYTGRATLRERDRRDLPAGSRIRIEHLQSDPARSWISGYEPGSAPVWVVPLASLGLLLAAGTLPWRVMRDWMLLSGGRFAEARVVTAKKVHRQHHGAYRVNYEFQTLSGARVVGASEMGRKPPVVGPEIPIVYYRENPRWSKMYPLSLVRPSGHYFRGRFK